MRLTPRWFLPCFFLPVLGLAAPAPSHLIYIGTVTQAAPSTSRGIYALRLDPTTGKLTVPVLAATVADPTFLALSPDRRFLYAAHALVEPVNNFKGAASAYSIDATTGGLALLNLLPTGGNGAVHLATDRTGRALLLAHYSSASVVSFPLAADGRIGARVSFNPLTGTSPAKPERQTGPFPHSVAVAPDNRHLYVPALGQDKVVKFKLDAAKATLEPADPAAHTVTPGAGPRHSTFSTDGKFYYVLNELDGTVDVLAYEAAGGKLTPVQSISGLPAGFTGQSTAAEIRAHPNGKFIYSSNRGHDSIAVFARDAATGRLTLVENTPSGGKHPRNFALSPDGAWLLCANRDTNNLVVFAVDAATGRLKRVGDETKLDRPVCVVFAN